MSVESIINKLHNKRIYEREAPKAAVLIPFIETGKDWGILFEQRSVNISAQPGDICFPGGRIEKDETKETAVIREACEELLINPGQIEFLTYLGEAPGPRGGDVSVFVGIIREYDFTYSREEVQEVFCVPLNWILSTEPKGYDVTLEQKTGDDFPFEDIYGGRDYRLKKTRLTHYFYYYNQYVIWGFTAKVLLRFKDMIKDMITEDTDKEI